MLKEIDGYYVAAQARLLRQVRNRTILVVEGPSDAKVFRRFVDDSACEIEVGFGKSNVCEAMDLLEDEGFPGVIGVIDADFDRITGTTYGLENLCVTDGHDLDLMIFLSSSLERYIEEFGDRVRIEKQFRDIAAVRAKIIDCCLPLAYCRLVSECRKLRLRFSDVRHDGLGCANS